MTQRRALSAVLLTAAISVFLCPAQAVQMAPNHVIDVPENGTVDVTCYVDQGLHPVFWKWTLITETNKSVFLGACDSESRRCTPVCTDIVLDFYKPTSAFVDFKNIQRDKGGDVLCSVMFADNSTESVHQRLNIYKLPVVGSCSGDTVRHNWSMALSCEVSTVFSTADLYTFETEELYRSNPDMYQLYFHYWGWQWKYGFDPWKKTRAVMWVHDDKFTGTPGDASDSTATVLHGRKSYQQALSAYINSTDHKAYYRGKLVHSWAMESFPAVNLTITIKVCSGYQSDTCTESVISMPRISKPSAPRHNCTDLHYLPETGGIPCLCTADDLGSPAGRLMWMRGDVAMVTGEYGVHQLLLPADLVTRELNHQQVACQLDWVKPQRAILPLNVTYGPDDVDLRVYQHHDASDQLLIVVECHVTALNPRAPDMVQWEGPCQGQAGFTCTLDPKDREVQGKAVRCRVTNTHNNGHSAEAADTIHTGKAADCSSSFHMQWAAVHAAVMVVVVVVVTALVFMMVWMCRHGLARHPYRTLPPVPNPDQIYKNAGCSEQEAHM